RRPLAARRRRRGSRRAPAHSRPPGLGPSGARPAHRLGRPSRTCVALSTPRDERRGRRTHLAGGPGPRGTVLGAAVTGERHGREEAGGVSQSWTTTPITTDVLRGVLELEQGAHGVVPHRLPAWARAQCADPQLHLAEG